MPYSDKDYKDTNVNYLNKDFPSLKRNLIQYAKTYFPNSYKDFNETSTGMMLMEMSAYVGDVLSFYVDQQYKEMLLPLAEERRNIMNIARMLGYKVKPIVPAIVDIKFTQTVDATGDNTARVPDFTQAVAVDKGLKITSVSNSDVIFETLGELDFTITGSIEWEEASRDSDDITATYNLTKYVRSISGETKSKTFTVGAPEKFLELTLPETNVINVISVIDSSGNTWYEVDYLAQDRVPLEKHYSTDTDRNTDVYTNVDGNPLSGSVETVEYSLRYIQSTKRFITQTNDDNTTSLVFGNGVLRNGQTLGSAYLDTEQVGLTIPGQGSDLDQTVNDVIGDDYDTLGEAPAQTSMTVTYRVGGGIATNVAAEDLTSVGTPTYLVGSNATLAATNPEPAFGGADEQSVNEIRERAKANFTTQNRCVTKEDFEARTLAMPSRFGSIAKVYANRTSIYSTADFVEYIDQGSLTTDIAVLKGIAAGVIGIVADGDIANVDLSNMQDILDLNNDGAINETDINFVMNMAQIPDFSQTIPTIELYILAYDGNKNLARLKNSSDAQGGAAHLILQNLRNYISNYRMVTDEIAFKQGYVINFGVVFDVTAHRHANKREVKLACIQTIIDYFNIEKMQFRQPIYISKLEYELMSLDGVMSVNSLKITQGDDPDDASATDLFNPNLYTLKWNPNTETWEDDLVPDGAGQAGYGYYYDFANPSVLVNGVINPPVTPSVFELKNPKDNVKGVVR